MSTKAAARLDAPLASFGIVTFLVRMKVRDGCVISFVEDTLSQVVDVLGDRAGSGSSVGISIRFASERSASLVWSGVPLSQRSDP